MCDRALRELGWALAAGPDLTLGNNDVPSSSWNDLPADNYYQHGDRRPRRFSTLAMDLDTLAWQARITPFRQLGVQNTVFGNGPRTYEPLTPEVLNSIWLEQVLETDVRNLHPALTAVAAGSWRVDLHQIRSVASHGARGVPSPEGFHQDGVQLFAIHCVTRYSIEGGVTHLRSLTGEPTFRGALQPGQVLYIDDRRLVHHTTEIFVDRPTVIGHRDILLVSFVCPLSWEADWRAEEN